MKKYKVVKAGLDSYKIGDEIDLTDDQAKSRVNKVELIAEVKKKSKKAAK